MLRPRWMPNRPQPSQRLTWRLAKAERMHYIGSMAAIRPFWDLRPTPATSITRRLQRKSVPADPVNEVTYENRRLRGHLLCGHFSGSDAVAEASDARHPAHSGRQAESHRACASNRGRQAGPFGSVAENFLQV